MLQRSPSYVLAIPSSDPIADFLRRHLPARLAYGIVRWKNVLVTMFGYQLSRRRPEFMKRFIRRGVEARLPAGYDVDRTSSPATNPGISGSAWRPTATSSRRSAAATPTSSPTGSTGSRRPGSGSSPAPSSTRTSSSPRPVSTCCRSAASNWRVDGRPVELPKLVGYKGIMFDGVPNMAIAIGYTNASWTLKCDLAAHYVCRLLNHMDEHGYDRCTPALARPGPTGRAVPGPDLRLRRSARSTSSRNRARGRPGACIRTTPGTCSCSSTGRWPTRR